MRLCVGFTFCDNAADIFYKGEALCGGCANRKYGSSVGLLAAIQLQEVRGPDPSGAALGSGPPSVPVLAAGPLQAASVDAVSPAAPFADYLLSGEWTLGDVEFLTELYERGER
jgi:hypothetical protein